ncbi:cholecystokinin receptor type A-like [Mercenaria mercenaria]|uniref:cholecystokinin receptor type A-like n=1 Tax=Mercenaria mercenaria TaxID=6596 RepID=UPI00234EBE48|nr:cholecystokinin receptor type A-like [Mercenaria mercenaria]XP_053377662.1 cholecystokinin receptor type A-like [Mercenaria mercenaria]
MQNNTKSDSLNKLIHEEILRQIPLMVYLIILCITGIAGNILVCYIYTKKYTLSTFRIFVTVLGAADLFISSIIIPLELLQFAWQYTFSSVAVCKLTLFVKAWATIASSSLLFCIAVDRYRKVCKPFSWQISFRAAKIMCFGCAFLGVAFSWISPVIYNIQTKELDVYNVTISECAITDSMKKTVFPMLNNVSLALLFVGALTGIIIMYTLIAIRVKQHLKKKINASMRRRQAIKIEACSEKHTASDGNKYGNASESNTLEISNSDFSEQGNKRRKREIEMEIVRGSNDNESSDIFKVSDAYITDIDNASDINGSKALNAEFGLDGDRRQAKQIDIGIRNTYSEKKESDKVSEGKITATGDALTTPQLDSAEKKPTEACKNEKSTLKRSSNENRNTRNRYRTTLIMFLVSLAFIVSYLPLLSLLLIVNADKTFAAALTDSERAAYKFFHRSYLLNCAVNPVIYGIWDVRFRKSCKMMLMCRKS